MTEVSEERNVSIREVYANFERNQLLTIDFFKKLFEENFGKIILSNCLKNFRVKKNMSKLF